ncbi:uncharacterized protein [Rutidosis leptorrhynchoides]|uniref:uncharacterized protein n=1 Tax=Rutidosis leptorrhynchoides TaxID=125765 RepID=UPI003A999231
MKVQFGPSSYEDPIEALTRLTQKGIVQDYQLEFQTLCCKTRELSDKVLKSCFIACLKPEIRREVKSKMPFSLSQTIGLAKMYEAKLTDKLQNSWQYRNQETERARKDARGECYNCEEKWSRTHKCGAKENLHVLDVEDDEELEDLENGELLEETAHDTPCKQPVISLHALWGHANPKVLRMEGSIGNKKIQLMIDSGSSHNFIQEKMVKYLNLALHLTDHFNVMVGNGQSLKCLGKCVKVLINIQDYKFEADFFVIDLHGADAILSLA